MLDTTQSLTACQMVTVFMYVKEIVTHLKSDFNKTLEKKGNVTMDDATMNDHLTLLRYDLCDQ